MHHNYCVTYLNLLFIKTNHTHTSQLTLIMWGIPFLESHLSPHTQFAIWLVYWWKLIFI